MSVLKLIQRWFAPVAGASPQPAAMDVAAELRAAHDAAERGDYQEALAIWGPLAHAGVARAQNNIGACFAEGHGVARDPELALRWLTLAAEAGDPVGQRNLAELYFKGEGVAQNDDEARRWYLAASEQGDAAAQDMLSWMMLESGSPEEFTEARRWALAAAEGGVATAMTRMGMIYHEAHGVDRNPELAAQWWKRAADAGDADGQAMLGAAYFLGQGVPKDGVAAFALLLRARRGGSVLSRQFLKPAQDALSEAEIAKAREAAE